MFAAQISDAIALQDVSLIRSTILKTDFLRGIATGEFPGVLENALAVGDPEITRMFLPCITSNALACDPDFGFCKLRTEIKNGVNKALGKANAKNTHMLFDQEQIFNQTQRHRADRIFDEGIIAGFEAVNGPNTRILLEKLAPNDSRKSMPALFTLISIDNLLLKSGTDNMEHLLDNASIASRIARGLHNATISQAIVNAYANSQDCTLLDMILFSSEVKELVLDGDKLSDEAQTIAESTMHQAFFQVANCDRVMARYEARVNRDDRAYLQTRFPEEVGVMQKLQRALAHFI